MLDSRLLLEAILVAVLLGWVYRLRTLVPRRPSSSPDSPTRPGPDGDALEARSADAKARPQAVIDSVVHAVIVVGATGRIESFGDGARRLFGYTASEVIGRHVDLVIPPDPQEGHGGIADHLAKVTASSVGVNRDLTGRRRDGTTFPLHVSLWATSIGGSPACTLMLHDLSAGVELEARLRASEARWESVIESAVDGIVVINAQGLIESFNPAAERLFGYADEDVIGKNVSMLMPSPYHEEHDAYVARYLATGVPKIIGTGREVAGLHRDGTVFPVHLSVGEQNVGPERKFTGIIHDLSARVRIETQLREATAMARLGEMAAVIAHEVKNPLAGVRGAIQVIGGRLPTDSKDALIIKEIVSRLDALNELMQELLLFARPPQPRSGIVDVGDLVTATADFLRTDPTMSQVEVRVDGSAPSIEADADLLKIVFINLLVNSAHAMHGRGTIRVSLTANADACQIAIADAGPGIPADVREKIFTPFFTTKARGSGLGLVTAKRLVEAHHGRISVACPPEGGTIVSIVLPAPAVAAT